jgi:hypothetical protein
MAADDPRCRPKVPDQHADGRIIHIAGIDAAADRQRRQQHTGLPIGSSPARSLMRTVKSTIS